MSGFIDYLKALWMGFISLPVILVIIQFLSTQMGLSRVGVFVTMYKGTPLSINYIVRWLLISEKDALHGFNFWAIILTWSLGWFIISDWVRNVEATAYGVLSTYGLYIFYLTIYHRYPLKLFFPESFLPMVSALLVTMMAYYLRKLKRSKSFFERLREAGIEFPKAYMIHMNLPNKCSNCGAIILSNSKYCWRCGEDLEKSLVVVKE